MGLFDDVRSLIDTVKTSQKTITKFRSENMKALSAKLQKNSKRIFRMDVPAEVIPETHGSEFAGQRMGKMVLLYGKDIDKKSPTYGQRIVVGKRFEQEGFAGVPGLVSPIRPGGVPSGAFFQGLAMQLFRKISPPGGGPPGGLAVLLEQGAEAHKTLTGTSAGSIVSKFQKDLGSLYNIVSPKNNAKVIEKVNAAVKKVYGDSTKAEGFVAETFKEVEESNKIVATFVDKVKGTNLQSDATNILAAVPMLTNLLGGMVGKLGNFPVDATGAGKNIASKVLTTATDEVNNMVEKVKELIPMFFRDLEAGAAVISETVKTIDDGVKKLTEGVTGSNPAAGPRLNQIINAVKKFQKLTEKAGNEQSGGRMKSILGGPKELPRGVHSPIPQNAGPGKFNEAVVSSGDPLKPNQPPIVPSGTTDPKINEDGDVIQGPVQFALSSPPTTSQRGGGVSGNVGKELLEPLKTKITVALNTLSDL